MTRDAIETQQRPPWWRPQQHTVCMRAQIWVFPFFSLTFRCLCLYLQNNKKWSYISFLYCRKEKFNFGFRLCCLFRTVTTKTINVNKYAAKHLKSVVFSQSWTKTVFQILFNAMTCLEKDCHVLKDGWIPAVKRDGRSVYRHGHQAIWIYLFQSPNESSAEK